MTTPAEKDAMALAVLDRAAQAAYERCECPDSIACTECNLAAPYRQARAHLAARIDQQAGTIDGLKDIIREHEARATRAEAELAAAKVDAERLDWLERTKRGTVRMDFLDMGSILGLVPRYLHWGEGSGHATLRASIDAARGAG